MFYDAQRASNFVIDNEEIPEEDILNGKSSGTIFPAPESKEFILRTFANRPFKYSAACPQRMYALIRDNETEIWKKWKTYFWLQIIDRRTINLWETMKL